MPSSYIGSDAAFFGTLSLMTGGDRPTASVFRVPLERLLDNCAYLEARMIDMLDGGTYAPTNPIIIGGDGLTISTILSLQSGADLDVNAGAQISVEGNLDVSGEVNIESGGVQNVLSGGSIVGAAGSLITLAEIDDLQMTTADSVTFVLSLCPSHVTQTVVGVDDWLPQSDSAWLQHATTGSSFVLFPIRALPGDDIASIQIEVDGSYGVGHGGSPPAPGDRVLIELISVSPSGAVTVEASKEDDVAGAGYDAVHTVSITSAVAGIPYTVASNRAVYLRITGETGANAVADTTAIRGISGTIVARKYRNTSEIY